MSLTVTRPRYQIIKNGGTYEITIIGNGISNFTQLNDAFTLTGQGGKFVRVKADETGLEPTASAGTTDEAAIHEDVASEIAGLTEKTTLHNNDLFIIEDSEALFVKKKVKKSNVATTSDLTNYFNKTTDDLDDITAGVTNVHLTSSLKTNYDTAYTHSQASHAPADAEKNVQADWNQADSGADDYIKNKPTITTPPTTEEIQDIVGAMVSSNTETGISVTYDDVNGKLDFSVTASGAGDVVGPASSTDNAITRFDSTTGKAIQNSLATIDDSGSVNIPSGQSYKINNTALAYGDVGAEPANANIQSHISSTSNPHSVTAAQAGAIASGGAYSDLSTNTKIGTGATQVAAGDHTHSGVYEPADANIQDAVSKRHSQNTDSGTTGNTFTIDSDSTTGKIIIDVALGASDNSLTITNTALTGNRTATFKNADGTVAYTTDIPVKATGAEIDTGTDDAKFATAKAITDSGLLFNVVEDTTPQLGGDLDMNGKCINLGNTLTSDGTFVGIIKNATVDTNSVGVGCILAIGADGNYDEADADAIANAYALAVACETGTGTKKILLVGQICVTAWNWTVGSPLYLSTTLGTMSHTPVSGTDDVSIICGFALSADTIYFQPGYAWVTKT